MEKIYNTKKLKLKKKPSTKERSYQPCESDDEVRENRSLVFYASLLHWPNFVISWDKKKKTDKYRKLFLKINDRG